MAAGELARTYASLILHDDGIEITAENINNLVKDANVSVESYWPSLFAKLAEKKNIEDLILNAGSGAAAGGDAAAAPAAVENKRLMLSTRLHGKFNHGVKDRRHYHLGIKSSKKLKI